MCRRPGAPKASKGAQAYVRVSEEEIKDDYPDPQVGAPCSMQRHGGVHACCRYTCQGVLHPSVPLGRPSVRPACPCYPAAARYSSLIKAGRCSLSGPCLLPDSSWPACSLLLPALQQYRKEEEETDELLLFDEEVGRRRGAPDRSPAPTRTGPACLRTRLPECSGGAARVLQTTSPVSGTPNT